MFFKKGVTVTLRLLISLLILFFVPSCGRAKELKPISLENLQACDLRIPIPYLDSEIDQSYKDLNVIYYYSDDTSEELLITYFTMENESHQKVRVARLSTCKHCGQLVGTDDTKGQSSETIEWAKGEVGVCKANPPTFKKDWFEGEPFQSCLYWIDGELNKYKLYTIWPNGEAVDFANSLSMIKPPYE